MNTATRKPPVCRRSPGIHRACLLGLACLWIAGFQALQAAKGAGDAAKKPDAWYAGEDARRMAANVLSHQSDAGGWPKNTDTTAQPFAGDRKKIQPTFDNGATTDELRFLARMYHATREERYRQAFAKGCDYILNAQYPTGGWPQYHPPPEKSYHRHITFNDNSMVRLMEFLGELHSSDRYAFVDAARKEAARAAFDRGVRCILNCQIQVEGKLAVWCAQHDEKDFRPRAGRSYERVSFSGAESVGLTRLLMSLERPGPEVVRAVEAAVAWFAAAKLTGIRIETRADPARSNQTDRVVIRDPSAPPLWARFYEIASNRPLFVDRDGVPKHSLAEIGHERRNGYAWYGTWPQSLLEKEYPEWKQKHPAPSAP